MEITAGMVKELRECTGAGMMDCKKALGEAEGDMEKAVDILRTKGLADLAKKAGRATNEGLIAAFVAPGAGTAALIEVNCETDFVARNDDFQGFVSTLAEQVATAAPDSIEALLSQPSSAKPELTVEQLLGETVGKLGENMNVARFVRLSAEGDGIIGAYIHGVGRIGVLVHASAQKSESSQSAALATFAKDVAMHIAAAAPGWVSRDDVPSSVVEHERAIYLAQAAETGKPEPIQAKIAEGRLDKFFKEVCLVEQPFVKDPDITIQQLAQRVSAELGDEVRAVKFVRWVLGESSTAGE